MEFLSHDAKNAINQHKNLEDKYENSCLKFSYLLEEFEEEKHEFECFLKKTWEEIHSFSDKKLILPEEINKVQSLSNITNENFATVNISTSSYSSTAELYGSTTSHSSTAELYGSDSAECQDISVQTSFQVHSDNSNIFVLPSNHTSVLDVLPSNHTTVSEFDISHMTSHNGYVNVQQILNKVPINETYLLDSPVSAVVNGTKTLSRESDISQKIKIDNLEDVSEKIPNENCNPHSTDDSEKIPNETCNIYLTDNSGKIPNESCNAPSADSFGKMSNQICNPHLTVDSEKKPNGNSSDNSGKIPNKNHNSLMDVCEKSQINVHSKFEDLFRKTYDDQSLYITQMTPTDNNEFFSNEKVSPINKTYSLRNKRTLHGFLSSTFIDNASNQTIEKEKSKHGHLESVNFTPDSEKFLNPNDTNIDMSLIKSLKQKENKQKHTLLVTCVTPITPHDSESSDFSFINPNDTNVCMSLVKRARLEYVEKENELYDNPNDTGNIYSYYHPSTSKTKHLPSVPFQIKNVSKSEEFLVTSSDKAIEISDVNNKTSLQEAHPLQEVSCLQEVHSLQKNSGISCSMDSLIDFKIHCQTGDIPNKVDLCTQIVQPNTNISKTNELTDKIELDKSNVITVKNVRNEHKEKNLSPVLPDTKSETSEPPFSCNTAIINIKNKEIKSANRKKKSRKKVKLCMPSRQPKTDSKYTFVSYSNLRENEMSVNATYLRKISHATNETKVLHCLTESQTKVQHPKKMKENIFSKSLAGRMEKILEINSCEEIKKNVKDSSLLNKNSFNPVAESQNKVKQTNKSKDAFLIKNSPSNLEKVLELNFLSNNSGCLQNFIDIIDDSRNLRRRTNRSCNKDRNSQVIISSNQNDSLQLPQPGRLSLNNTNLLQKSILQRNSNDSVKLNCTVCSTSSENSVGASATPISNVLCQKCICALRDIDRKSNVRSSKRLAEKSLLVQTLLGTKRHKSKQDPSYKECDKIPIPTKVTAKILPCSTTNNNTNVNIVDKKTNLNSISSTYALRSRRKNLLSFENNLTEKTDHGKKKKQANKKIYLYKKKKPRKKVKFVDKQTDEELANLERKKTKKTVMLDDRNSVKEISSNNDTVSTLLTHLNNTVIKKPTKENICVPKEVIRKPARENVCVTKEVIRKPAKENIYVPNKVTTSPTKENICVPQKSILDIPRPFFTKQAEVKKDNVFIMNPPLDNLNNNAIPNLSSTLSSTTNMSRLSGETTASYLGRRKKTLLKKYGNRIMTPDRPPLNSTQIEKLGTSRIFENNDIEVSGISNQTKISRSRLLSLAVENATLGIPETLTQYLNKFNSQTTSLTKK